MAVLHISYEYLHDGAVKRGQERLEMQERDMINLLARMRGHASKVSVFNETVIKDSQKFTNPDEELPCVL